MPTRRVTAPAHSNGIGALPQQRIETLLLERERLVAELSAIQARGDESKSVEEALQLVTRWWGPATWAARERLLKSARWLLNLKHRTDEPKLAQFEQSRTQI
ncbi:MAG: hypothetical protein QOD94_2936 [Alphaproteobacteria bacterium]|jgi:hypothetical protein|nr:hypothetical protein [Alphaproteobacteria bacterium]